MAGCRNIRKSRACGWKGIETVINWNSFISWSGFCTGILGTMISISNWWKNRPRIKIKSSDSSDYSNVLIPGKYMASYSDDSVILNLTFINKRSSSISVGLVQAWNYKTRKWNSVGIENKIIGMINVKTDYSNNYGFAITFNKFTGIEVPFSLKGFEIKNRHVAVNQYCLSPQLKVKLRFLTSTGYVKHTYQCQTLETYVENLGYKLS